jgi:hypothetical protein
LRTITSRVSEARESELAIFKVTCCTALAAAQLLMNFLLASSQHHTDVTEATNPAGAVKPTVEGL